MEKRRDQAAPLIAEVSLLLHLAQEAQEIEQEVDEVQVDLLRDDDRVEIVVVRLADAVEVDQEEPGENDHTNEAVDDRHAAGKRHEDVDDSNDDQTEERDHQPLLQPAEIASAEGANETANRHDTTSAQVSQEHSLPAELMHVCVHRRTEEQSADECPPEQGSQAELRGLRCGEGHHESTGDEQDEKHDERRETADTGAEPGAESADQQGTGQKHANLGEQGRARTSLSRRH